MFAFGTTVCAFAIMKAEINTETKSVTLFFIAGVLGFVSKFSPKVKTISAMPLLPSVFPCWDIHPVWQESLSTQDSHPCQ
jgi:hypothetical protein